MSSSIEVDAGETEPGRNGAGISANILSISSSPNVLDASLASCSHDNIEPRDIFSFPYVGRWGLREGELLSLGGRGERYERLARPGRLEDGRVGVWGWSRCRVLVFRIRGMEGVGAARGAMGARRSSTSSASELSSLSPSEIWDIFPTRLDSFREVGVLLPVEVLPERRDSGESGGPKGERRRGLDSAAIFSRPERFKPRVLFKLEVLGVRGVKEPAEEVDEGGRGMAEAEPEALLTCFVGREGDVLVEVGAPIFFFGGGVEGLTFIAERLILIVALCGKGLIGRESFSVNEGRVFLSSAPGVAFLSSLSSSELLKRLRVPARAGEGGFKPPSSIATDLGRYFGKADCTLPVLVRGLSVADRITPEIGGCGVVGLVAG